MTRRRGEQPSEHAEHPSEDVEEKISLNDRTSASIFPTRNGDIVTYDDGAKRYTVYLDGRIAVADEKKDFFEQEFLDPTSREGKKVIKRIQVLASRDQSIHDAREAEGKRLANGDPLLVDVLAHAIEYGEGRAQKPVVLDGVELYPVGGNASARMYLGAKDGRLYYYCFDDAMFTILPDGRGDQISEGQMIDRVIQQIFDEWYRMDLWTRGKSEAEWRKEMPGHTFEAMGKHREKVFQEFMRKHGASIRRLLEPSVHLYKAAGRVSKEENHIRLTLDEKIFDVYVKPVLKDVTNQKQIYLGRGAVFVNRNAEAGSSDNNDKKDQPN